MSASAHWILSQLCIVHYTIAKSIRAHTAHYYLLFKVCTANLNQKLWLLIFLVTPYYNNPFYTIRGTLPDNTAHHQRAVIHIVVVLPPVIYSSYHNNTMYANTIISRVNTTRSVTIILVTRVSYDGCWCSSYIYYIAPCIPYTHQALHTCELLWFLKTCWYFSDMIDQECDHAVDQILWPTKCAMWPESIGTQIVPQGDFECFGGNNPSCARMYAQCGLLGSSMPHCCQDKGVCSFIPWEKDGYMQCRYLRWCHIYVQRVSPLCWYS
jgi:hypothetical protein